MVQHLASRLWAAVALGVLLAACAPAAPIAPAPLTATMAETGATPLEAGVALVTPELAFAATPTARRGLEATDPTTVQLASGRPLLVEFFAFW
jgi:hypothetical protein